MSSESDVGDSDSDASSDLRECLDAALAEAERLREELSVMVVERDALHARVTQLELELQNMRESKCKNDFVGRNVSCRK